MADFVNSVALIYDEDGGCIAKAVVLEHDEKSMYIEVSDGLDGVKTGKRLDITVISPGGAFEFSGVARKKNPLNGARELALFNQRRRSTRAAARHVFNTPGTIKKITVNSEEQPLDAPLPIFVVNLSSKGVLVRYAFEDIQPDSVVEIHVNINERDIWFNGLVLRVDKNDENTYDYGCKLIFGENDG